MFRKLLLRDIQFHPWLWVLSLLGVAIGVAGWVGMKTAADRAIRAFEQSLESSVGRATHIVRSRSGSLDESVLYRLARETDATMSPVLQVYARSAGPGPDAEGSRLIKVVGIDPITFFPFYDLRSGGGETSFPVDEFVTGQPVFVGPEDVGTDRSGVLTLRTGDRTQRLRRASTTELPGERTIYVDLGWLQEWTGQSGTIDRILLRNPRSVKALRERLPDGVLLQTTGTHTESLSSMLQAYRWNLHALAFLSLFVGGFLVYSSMVLYSNRQQNVFSLLRTLGWHRSEVLGLALLSVMTLATVGSLLGVVLGWLLSRPLGDLAVTTVDLTFSPLFSAGTGLSYRGYLMGFVLGIGVSLLGAAGPLLRNWGVTPRQWQLRSRVPSSDGFDGTLLSRITLGGFLLLGMAGGLVIGWSRSLIGGYLACFLVALAGSLLTVLLVPLVGRLPWRGRWLKMAARNLSQFPLRSSVMVGSLVAAFSMVFAVTVMVDSFRGSIEQWAEGVVKADFYVRTAPRETTPADPAMSGDFIESLRRMEGVAAVSTLRKKTVYTRDGHPILVRGIDANIAREREVIQFNRALSNPRRRLTRGEVLLSEPGAYRMKLQPGDTLSLPRADGRPVSVRVAAVFNDYSPRYAMIYVRDKIFQEWYPGVPVRDLGVFLTKTADPKEIGPRIRARAVQAGYYVQSNRALKRRIMAQFEQNFAVTNIMKLIASLIAVVGLMVTLISLNRSRAPLFGRLRASGSSRWQVVQMIGEEGLLVGLISLLGALPTGWLLSYVLINVVNRRSFGWTIHMELDSAVLGNLVVLIALSVLLGLLFPVVQMLRTSLSDLLREGREFVE